MLVGQVFPEENVTLFSQTWRQSDDEGGSIDLNRFRSIVNGSRALFPERA